MNDSKRQTMAVWPIKGEQPDRCDAKIHTKDRWIKHYLDILFTL